MTAPNLGLLSPNNVKQCVPDWPFGPWWTRELIRRGELGCVRLGRRVFVTRELLDAYLAAHTQTGGAK